MDQMVEVIDMATLLVSFNLTTSLLLFSLRNSVRNSTMATFNQKSQADI